MIILIGVSVFTKVCVLLPYDVWYYCTYVNDESQTSNLDPFSFELDIEPYYRADNYEDAMRLVNGFMVHLCLRVAILLDITRWSLLLFSLKVEKTN